MIRIAFYGAILVELERNFKIQLVASTPNLQAIHTGETGARPSHPLHTLLIHCISPALPPSVVLPTQVLPPQHLNPSCSGSVRTPGEMSPRWQGGQAGGSSTFPTTNNQQPQHTFQGGGKRDSGDASERLTDRLVNYLLTEKREGKP